MKDREADCDCEEPKLRAYKGGNCQRCAKLLFDDYLSNDDNLAEFFGLVSDIPGVDTEILSVAAQRERDGRDFYGLAYLSRNNIAEAIEEVADLIVYLYLHRLRGRRDGYEVDMASLLEAAMHGAYAYNALRRMLWDVPESR